MKYRSLFFSLVTASVIMMAGVLVGCSSKPAPEEQAKAVFQEALDLESQGRSIDAMKAFNRLQDYKDTEFYKEAEQRLWKRGISIGSALESWTIIKMEEIRNEMIRTNQETHKEGDATVPIIQRDAWGNNLWVEYAVGAAHSFAVLSAGPDGLFKTEDDLVLFRKKPGTTAKDPAAMQAFKESISSPAGGRAAAGKKDGPPPAAAGDISSSCPEKAVKKEHIPLEAPGAPAPPQSPGDAKTEKKAPKPVINQAGETVMNLEDLLNTDKR